MSSDGRTVEPRARAVACSQGVAAKPRRLATRRLAIRIVYGLVSLLTLVMSLGVVMLAAGDVPDGPYGFAAASTTAWKLLSLGGYLVIAWTGGRSVLAVQWVLVGDLTWLLADLVAPQDPSESVLAVVGRTVVNALIFLGPWFLLAPERREVFHLRARPDRGVLSVVALATPALAFWAWHNASLDIPTVEGNSGPELEFDVTGLALVFITVGLLAGLRLQGNRWLVLVVAAGSLYVGVDALLTPATDVASPGAFGGTAFLVCAGLIVARVWRSDRGSPGSTGSATRSRWHGGAPDPGAG